MSKSETGTISSNSPKAEKFSREQNVKAAVTVEVVSGERPGKVFFAGRRFHFVGAGGVGMSGLAKLLVGNKAIVSGSDMQSSAAVDKLCKLGADIKIGHAEENIPEEVEAVVISAAIDVDNPEIRKALQNGIKVYKYAEMLGEVMDSYRGIAISGTHGKSTSSGWLTVCLDRLGLSPNYLVGAEISQLGDSSGSGESDIFIAEACEYDRSFLNLYPSISCIGNIEADHLDYYSGNEEIVEAFSAFACNTRRGGTLVANGNDENVGKVLEKVSSGCDFNVVTFGLKSDCEVRADNIRYERELTSFDVMVRNENIGKASIQPGGEHNINNSLAVTAMGIAAGVNPEAMVGVLGEFSGIDRRVMLKGVENGITVIDDYAHHPTEIRASLEAIRQKYEPRRVWCVFQPHQYSRTRFLLDDFAQSFTLADVTIVPDIYFVRDSLEMKKHVNADILAERIRGQNSESVHIDGFGKICDYLMENVKPGDLVVTMGAGDVWKVADGYIRRLREDS